MNHIHDLRGREFSLHQLGLTEADLVLEGEPQPRPDDWVTLNTPVVGPWSLPGLLDLVVAHILGLRDAVKRNEQGAR